MSGAPRFLTSGQSVRHETRPSDTPRANGQTLERPRVELDETQLATVKELGIDRAAEKIGISRSTLYRRLSQRPPQ